MQTVVMGGTPTKLAGSNQSKRDRESFVPFMMLGPTDTFARQRGAKAPVAKQVPTSLMGIFVAVMALSLVLAVGLLLSGQALFALVPAVVLVAAGVGSVHPQVVEALTFPLIERR